MANSLLFYTVGGAYFYDINNQYEGKTLILNSHDDVDAWQVYISTWGIYKSIHNTVYRALQQVYQFKLLRHSMKDLTWELFDNKGQIYRINYIYTQTKGVILIEASQSLYKEQTFYLVRLNPANILIEFAKQDLTWSSNSKIKLYNQEFNVIWDVNP